jgi:Ca-activated chloride channel family protein
MEVDSLFGSRTVNPSRDLDENTLRHLAQSTGGLYLRAKNTEALANVYRELDRLEPASTDTELFRPRTELFIWPLSLALALSVLMAVSLLVSNGFSVGTRWMAKGVDPRPLVER